MIIPISQQQIKLQTRHLPSGEQKIAKPEVSCSMKWFFRYDKIMINVAHVGNYYSDLTKILQELDQPKS